MTASHDHGHGHSHASPTTARTRLAIVFGLTALIVLAQAVGSVLTGSLALLTDTAHALVDASGLLVALVAATMLLRPASPTRTWGFARIEVLAALAQAMLLIVVGTYTAIEGVRRLAAPPTIVSTELLVFGAVGLAVNLVAVLVLAGGKDANLTMKAAFLEVANDALGSLGVILAALVIHITGFQQADALAGLFIAALIVPRAVRILRATLRILMEYTPEGVDLDEVREHLLALEHVQDVHDVHASSVGSGLPILSAHVVVGEECFGSTHAMEILEEVHRCVRTHFPVAFEHATIQMESPEVHGREAARTLHA